MYYFNANGFKCLFPDVYINPINTAVINLADE